MPSSPAERVFISYRRDDAAGYAGRLDESLERRLGRGSAFRDVLDIAPGEDFVQVIRQRLSGAAAVVVLIGPRWAGGDVPGQRRIDDEHDFVHLEVQAALESGARVVPVLLPGTTMPAEDELPAPLKALARRNALQISDPHWEADVDRLVGSLGMSGRRAVWPWALGGAAVAAAVVAALCWLWPAAEVDKGARLIGTWQAEVQYSGDVRHTERFVFERHAGELTGTSDFQGNTSAIEKASFDGTNLRFESGGLGEACSASGDYCPETIYKAELRGDPPDEVLAFRLRIGVGSLPIDFEARRAASAVSAASAPRRP